MTKRFDEHGRIELDQDLYEWDRQPGEPKPWYDRFNKFRLQGADGVTRRSVRELWVAEVLEIDKDADLTDKSLPKEWVSARYRYRWSDRAKAYDRYLTKADQNTVLQRKMDLMEKRLKSAAITRNIATLFAQFMLDAHNPDKADKMPAEQKAFAQARVRSMAFQDFLALMKFANDTERSEFGSENPKTLELLAITAKDVEEMSDEELHELAKRLDAQTQG